MLSTHHSRVWLDMAYSTGVKKLIINWIQCICTCGGGCVVGWCLDNPCGGSITGSCCSRSSYQYQCGAILSADVCVDAVHRLSVGRNQDCVPVCCISYIICIEG